MSDKYSYRPPLGFDISVSGSKGKAKKKEAASHTCEWEGCGEPAPHRAPRSPQRPNEYLWFCQKHAREYNRSWNFFAEMDDEEIKEYQEAAQHGNRPTWTMAANATTKDGKRRATPPGFAPGKSRPHGRGAQMKHRDAYGFLPEGATPREKGAVNRQLPKMQREALETLDLPETATMDDVRQRYKELVKKFHPDANGGNRGAEDRLRQVINAYRTLRSADFR